MSPRLTASRMKIAARCQYFLRPDATHYRAPSDDRISGPGSALHALIEGAPDAAAQVAALTAAERREVAALFAAWQASDWSRVPWRHEIAWVGDPAAGTARELPGRGREQYEAATEPLAGTADLVAVIDGTLWVADIKSGRQDDLEPAAENSQLATLAWLAATALKHAGPVRVATLHVVLDGVIADDAALDAWALDCHAGALAAVLAVEDAQPVPGSHCRWCPARVACPSTTSALAVVAPAAASLLGPIRDDAHAAQIVALMPALEAALAERLEAAKAHATARGGITLADGRTWGPSTAQRESIVLGGDSAQDEERADVAMTLLEAGNLAGAVEVTRKLSKEGLTATVRAQVLARHPAGTDSRVVAAEVRTIVGETMRGLREAGVVRTRDVTEFRARKPRAGKETTDGE